MRPAGGHAAPQLAAKQRSVRSGRSGKLAQETIDPDQCLLEVRQCCRIAASDISFARRAEDIPGNHGNALGVQELLSEFLGGQTGAADRRERIECSAGLRAVQPDFTQALDKYTAAA